MTPTSPMILTLNGGSSSIRFDLHRLGSEGLERRLHGKIDRIGPTEARLSFSEPGGELHEDRCAAATDFHGAIQALLYWLETQEVFATISAIGHRVVHGMAHIEPEIVTPALLDELRGFAWMDPDHLPGEIALIEALRERLPAVPQVACFDTTFHAGMPRVASMLALPRRLEAQGVKRYGFHGLSYTFLIEELARVAGADAARARVVLAHLGSGASLAAVQGGRGIDTTMGFTPAGGLPMSTRSGDIDPALAPFLARNEGMTAERLEQMLNHESGLLGVSQTSADMAELLAAEAADARAAEAVALFCYQVKKGIGAYAAALGGIDTLVFSGGIGENAPAVRSRTCAGLGFLGIELDEALNASSAELISTASARVRVRVLRTDEQLVMARAVCAVLGYSTPGVCTP